MYLYSKVALAGRFTVPRQIGYVADESASPPDVFQLDSSARLPTTNTFWPTVVVAFTANVTATVVQDEPGPFHVSVQVAAQPLGVVRARFGSNSQVTAPKAVLRMYLYWI